MWFNRLMGILYGSATTARQYGINGLYFISVIVVIETCRKCISSNM